MKRAAVQPRCSCGRRRLLSGLITVPIEPVHYFTLLKDYYREAMSKKHAMLIWIE